MQAQLQTNRFPRLFAVVLFALTVAILLGGALGYTLRASAPGSGPSHIVQQDTTGSAGSSTSIGLRHKAY
jgi:hypothetical protein